jgi:F420-dependent oxidoreductase-like protein
VKLGLAIADFTWGERQFGPTLKSVATTAEDAGFARIAVMDHVWQVGAVGVAEQEMLEAYTTLGFLAACTSKVELLTLVTAAVYREPGLLAKILTTLDVLSQGRTWLGIGVAAGWNEAEARGLGLPFPRTAERYERLEEVLRICSQMWSESQEPFHGKHYHLERTLNSPPVVRRPPILIGGSGEQKTLLLVARYADACNLFATPDIAAKLDVLRAHCAEIGRDYDEIEKTVLFPLDPGSDRGAGLVRRLEQFAALGVDCVYGPVRDAETLVPLEVLGEHVIPAVSGF